MEDITQLSKLTFKGHRLSENPMELKHLEVFKEKIDSKYSPNQMDFLVFGQNGNSPKDFLSDREKQIVYSTIQWLGSHVGECYLRDCGYELKKDK
jgi:hypothetical protein